jgi:hypothetical protein
MNIFDWWKCLSDQLNDKIDTVRNKIKSKLIF